jgi:hypothetical protein
MRFTTATIANTRFYVSAFSCCSSATCPGSAYTSGKPLPRSARPNPHRGRQTVYVYMPTATT